MRFSMALTQSGGGGGASDQDAAAAGIAFLFVRCGSKKSYPGKIGITCRAVQCESQVKGRSRMS